MLPPRSLFLGLTLLFPLTALAVEPELTAAHSGSDHARVLDHIGAAAFATGGSVPIGSGNPTNPSASTLSTPAVGIRWWLAKGGSFDVGLDLGLGLSFGTGSQSATTANAAGGTTTTTSPVTVGSGAFLHVGVPLAFMPLEHAVFELIPELDVGGAMANPNNTTSLGGFTLSIGARVGPEIQLGYFHLPQFGIQPTLGAFFNVNNFGSAQTTTVGGVTTKNSASQSTFGFATIGLGLSFFYYPAAT